MLAQPRHHLVQAASLVQSAFSWWIAQLISFVPPHLSALLARRRSLTVVDPQGKFVSIGRITGATYQQVARIDAAAATASWRSSPSGRSVRPSARLAVRLDPRSILVRRIRMPPAALPNLRQVLSYDMDRHVPFKAEEVDFDFRVGASRGSGLVDVELAVVPKSTVADAVVLTRQLGLVPSVVGVMGTHPDEPYQFNFLPNVRSRRLRTVELILMALCAAACVSIGFVWSAQQQRAIDALADAVASAKREADATDRVRGQITVVSRKAGFIARKQERITAIAVLTELTRILPDGTWIFGVELAGDSGRIRGFSPAASGLIGVIESSPHLGSAQFRAPVTQASQPGLERFDISFHVKNGSPR